MAVEAQELRREKDEILREKDGILQELAMTRRKVEEREKARVSVFTDIGRGMVGMYIYSMFLAFSF